MSKSLIISSLLFAAVQAANLVDTVSGQDNLSTLVSVLTTPEYKPVLDALVASEPFTLFAPSNEAFAAAGIDTTQVDAVTSTLQYHVVPAVAASTDLKASQFVPTLLTNEKYVQLGEGKPQVLKVTKDDAGVNVSYGLGKSAVVQADLAFDGPNGGTGYIHIIDSVLQIPQSPSATLVAAGTFKTLAGLLEATDLIKAVDTTAGTTVFAPTDDAFNALGEATIKTLTADNLKYHVVPAVAYSSDVETGELPTLDGRKLSTKAENGAVKINTADVVLADVITSTGVAHVVDAVLVPSAEKTNDKSSPTDTDKDEANTKSSANAVAATLSLGVLAVLASLF